jgi:hypothetical protein
LLQEERELVAVEQVGVNLIFLPRDVRELVEKVDHVGVSALTKVGEKNGGLPVATSSSSC